MKKSILSLLCLLTTAIGAFAANTSTITFTNYKDNTSTDALTLSTIQDQASAGADYISGFSCSNTYTGQYGIRLGQNKNDGDMTITFSDDITENVSKIEVDMSASKNPTKHAITINDTSFSLESSNTANTYKTFVLSYDSPQTVSSLKVAFTHAITGTTVTQGVVFVHEIRIYHTTLEELSKASADLSFVNDSYDIALGDSFTGQAVTNPHGVSGITYSTDNTDLVTVDASTGAVSLVSNRTGIATITASFDGDETYAESTLSYTITVKDPNALNATFDFSQLSSLNDGTCTATTSSSASIDNTIFYMGDIKCVCVKGSSTSTTDKLYTDNTLRVYAGNSLKIYTENPYLKIVGIEFTFGDSKGLSLSDGESGQYDSSTYKWIGEASSVTFGSTKAFVKKMVISYRDIDNRRITTLSWVDGEGKAVTTVSAKLGASDNALPTLSSTEEGGAAAVTYESSNSEVASIETDGTVTLNKAGETTISAYIKDNDAFKDVDKVSYALTVTDPSQISAVFEVAESDWLSLSDGIIYVGRKVTIKPSDDTATDYTIYYQVGDGEWQESTEVVTLTINAATTVKAYVNENESLTVTKEFKVSQLALTISKEFGQVDEDTKVTVSCDVKGATLSGTIGNTTLNGATLPYEFTVSDPLSVNVTASLDGYLTSEALTGDYIVKRLKLDNIAAWIEAASQDTNTAYTVKNPVTVSFANGREMFIFDDSGAIAVWGSAKTDYADYKAGDVISSISAKYNVNSGMRQMSAAVLGDKTTGTSFSPEVVLLSNINTTDTQLLARVVTVNGLTISATTGTSNTVTATDVNGSTIVVWNKYNSTSNYYNTFDLPTVGKMYNITGVVYRYTNASKSEDYMEFVPTAKPELIRASVDMSWSPNNVTVTVGDDTEMPMLTLQDHDALNSVKYSSDNEAVATVSSTGKIVAKSVGTAVITAAISDDDNYADTSVSCTVTVKESEPGTFTINFANSSSEVILPADFSFTYEDGEGSLTWDDSYGTSYFAGTSAKLAVDDDMNEIKGIKNIAINCVDSDCQFSSDDMFGFKEVGASEETIIEDSSSILSSGNVVWPAKDDYKVINLFDFTTNNTVNISNIKVTWDYVTPVILNCKIDGTTVSFSTRKGHKVYYRTITTPDNVSAPATSEATPAQVSTRRENLDTDQVTEDDTTTTGNGAVYLEVENDKDGWMVEDTYYICDFSSLAAGTSYEIKIENVTKSITGIFGKNANGDVVTGIAKVVVNAANGVDEWYNLQGVRVANPTTGIFIHRVGNRVEKVVVK